MAEFKDRIKFLRKRDNYSLSQLGEKVGIGKSAIAAWEAGQKFPRTPTLVELCEVFDVSMDYLLGTSNEIITKEQTRNLAILLSESNDFHYNGIPLSNDDLHLFNNILERMLKDIENKEENQDTNIIDEKINRPSKQ